MKSKWKERRLKDTCVFLNGLWKGEKPPFVTVGVIRSTNFGNDGSLDDSDIAYLEVEESKFRKRRLEYGDLILEKSGGGPKQPVGRVAIFDKRSGQFSFSNFTSAIRVIDKAILDFRFLHKYLCWLYSTGITESMQSHSTGIRNLNTNAYTQLHIPLPPLPEQQRIVGILDKAFGSIAIANANTGKNIANAQELFQSKLDALFEELHVTGVAKAPLSGLTRAPITYGVVKPGPEGTVPFIRGGDIANGCILTGQLRTITNSVSKQYKRTLLSGGELLISLVGQPGQVAVVPKSLSGANIARQVGLIVLDGHVRAEFVRCFLQSKVGRASLLLRHSGSVQQVINLGSLRSVSVPIPSERIQDRIVAQVEEFAVASGALRLSYSRKSKGLDELKQSLLNTAFSGEL